VQRTTLATLDDAGIAAAYAAAYEDYFVPMHPTAPWVQRFVDICAIDFSISPLWLDDDGAVIGMAAIGVRGGRGWVGGFGITKPYRGQGLSHELAAETIAAARARGLRQLWLEVLSQNAAAIRTYRRAGFRQVRDLLVLSHLADVEPSPLSESAVEVRDTDALLAARESMPAARPSWQREAASSAAITGLRGLAIGPLDAPRALALYRDDEAGFGLLDAAAGDGDAARRLVAVIGARGAGRQLSFVNEPEESELLPALLAAGWIESMRQHEMVVDLA
jgi:ribosomal protein S18 acetylase RimI-like enzyme